MKFYEALKAYEEGKEVQLLPNPFARPYEDGWLSKRGELLSGPNDYRIIMDQKWSLVASMDNWVIRDAQEEL